MRLKQPKVYPDEKLTVTLPGTVAREFRAYQRYYDTQGQKWEPAAMLASIIQSFCKNDKAFCKWKNSMTEEQLDALLFPDGHKKP